MIWSNGKWEMGNGKWEMRTHAGFPPIALEHHLTQHSWLIHIIMTHLSITTKVLDSWHFLAFPDISWHFLAFPIHPAGPYVMYEISPTALRARQPRLTQYPLLDFIFFLLSPEARDRVED